MSKTFFYGSLRKDAKAVAVIMAGGSGTRFWPMSRASFPKQFLPLGSGEHSLIQDTVRRLEGVSGCEVLVVTADAQKELVFSQLPNVPVLVEPHPRNTAPCIGYAAKLVLHEVGDVPMVCLPADHVVLNDESFSETIERAIALAATQDVLITLGITPTAPETGYGYIKSGGHFEKSEHFHVVEKFVEKPNFETAKEYVSSGHYLWNSGMFIWRPSVILAEIKKNLSTLDAALNKVGELLSTDAYEELDTIFKAIQGVSIDVGIMERASNAVMAKASDLGWSDVGSWSSWVDCVLSKEGNEAGNVFRGEVISVDSKNCAVINQQKPVALVGLEDVIVVETENALLVCKKSASQDVKKVVEKLSQEGKKELL